MYRYIWSRFYCWAPFEILPGSVGGRFPDLLTGRSDEMTCCCKLTLKTNLTNSTTLSPAKHLHMITRPPPYFTVGAGHSGTICSACPQLRHPTVPTINLRFRGWTRKHQNWFNCSLVIKVKELTCLDVFKDVIKRSVCCSFLVFRGVSSREHVCLTPTVFTDSFCCCHYLSPPSLHQWAADSRSIDAGISIQTEVACAPITGTSTGWLVTVMSSSWDMLVLAGPCSSLPPVILLWMTLSVFLLLPAALYICVGFSMSATFGHVCSVNYTSPFHPAW